MKGKGQKGKRGTREKVPHSISKGGERLKPTQQKKA
jgi:hypothetical protein